MGTMGRTPSGSAKRMFAAIIRHPSADYFLKAMGAPSEVDKVVDGVRKIANSIQIGSDNQIHWELPEGWTEKKTNVQFRLTTFVSPSGFEVLVSRLSAGQDLLMNINRWRGQLQLAGITEDKMNLEKTNSSNGIQILFFDQSNGKKETESNNSSTNKATTTANRPEMVELPFVLTSPGPKWKLSAGTTSSLKTWELTEEEKTASIGVYKFSSSAGFYQFGLVFLNGISTERVSEQQFKESTTSFEAFDQKGDLFTWPKEGTKSDKSLRLIRIVEGQNAWFFKFTGPSSMLEKRKKEFDSWVKGLQARKPEASK